MKWFISAMLGVLAANNLGFGWALAEQIWQTFGQRQCHQDMTSPKSATYTEPSQHCNIIIIHWTYIWRK
jgi:hypothetical protein